MRWSAVFESHSARSKVFKRLKNIIHCANGMLEISSDGSWELMPFSPAYYARNPTLDSLGSGRYLPEV